MFKERLNILSRDYSDLIKSMDNVLNNKTISLKDIKEYNITYYPDAEIIHNKYGSRNYFNYLFVKLNFYLSFLKFIYKYKGFFFINLGIRK